MLLIAFAIIFIWLGAGEILYHRRVSRWPTTKANVVRWSEALPGTGPTVGVIHEVVVTQSDGTEIVRRLDVPDPDAFYVAELVYFVDGVAHAADLGLRQPAVDSCELHYDPASPSSYAIPKPFPIGAALLVVLGGACILLAL